MLLFQFYFDFRLPISAIMALGATHHHLIEERQRKKVGLIVDTAEARYVLKNLSLKIQTSIGKFFAIVYYT